MGTTVTLRHGTFKGRRTPVHFYDGHLFAEDGLLTIPANKDRWIKTAFYDGYNLTPEGERLWNLEALRDYVALTTESAKDKNEGSSSGRQPTTKDRVRES